MYLKRRFSEKVSSAVVVVSDSFNIVVSLFVSSGFDVHRPDFRLENLGKNTQVVVMNV